MRASHRMREILYSSAKPLPPWIWKAVRRACGDAREHAGLEIAAPHFIPAAALADLAGDHDLRRHHGDLVGDAGKLISFWPNCTRSLA
jgi:hypothetical protein